MPASAGRPEVRRLKVRAEFLRASARGRKSAMPGLVLQLFRRDDGDERTRLGFTVTKKVGNAVVRNRVRRRLREAARIVLREEAAARSELRGADLVLIGRNGTLRRPFDALRRDLVSALDRAASAPPRGDAR